MKVFLFSAVVLVTALAMVPAAYACSGAADAASPQRSDSRKADSATPSETNIGVLVGLLLGIVLTDQSACPGCTDAH